AAGHDQRLPDRDRGDERAARQDVGEIVEAQETRIGQRAKGADQRQREKRRDRADVHAPSLRRDRSIMDRLTHGRASSAFASTPVASTTIACSVIASPATSPTTRPFRITTMRWQMPISSAISDEMTMTERPSAARAVMNR